MRGRKLAVLAAWFTFLGGCGRMDRGMQDLQQNSDRAMAKSHAESTPAGASATPRPELVEFSGAKPPRAHEPDAIASRFESKAEAVRDVPVAAPSTPRPVTELPPAKPDPVPTPSRPSQQSGQLTAGSIDDQRSYPEYLSYLDGSPLRRRLPQYMPSSRVVVTVRNDAGDLVPDARIVLQRGGQDPSPVASQVTGSDGRAAFLAGLDLPTKSEEFLVTVTAPNTEPASAKLSSADPEWTIVVPQAPRTLPRKLDLALVIDVTGSMNDELDYLKAEIDSIAETVKERFPGIEQRFALIVYRDIGDAFVTRRFDFTDSLAEFQSNLNAQKAAGGGDYPEAVDQALEQATTLSWSSNGAARVLFLVGDAPPHTENTSRTFDAARTLRHKGVSLFPVGASGVKDEAEFLFRAMAFITQSQYLFLTDHSGIGASHAKPQASRYEVERLDQLMIRMIAWKLSGDEHQAERIIDVGGTETQTSLVTPPQPSTPSQPTRPPAVAVAAPQPGASPTPAESQERSSAFALLWKSVLAVAVIGLAFGGSVRDGWRHWQSNHGETAPPG